MYTENFFSCGSNPCIYFISTFVVFNLIYKICPDPTVENNIFSVLVIVQVKRRKGGVTAVTTTVVLGVKIVRVTVAGQKAVRVSVDRVTVVAITVTLAAVITAVIMNIMLMTMGIVEATMTTGELKM